jgi:hypothetical protein
MWHSIASVRNLEIDLDHANIDRSWGNFCSFCLTIFNLHLYKNLTPYFPLIQTKGKNNV